MGIFRRQKDLLSRQRKELELDYLYESQAHRRVAAEVVTPGSPPPKPSTVWRAGRWVLTVAPERRRPFRERVTSVRGVLALAVFVATIVITYDGVLPDLAALYVTMTIALVDLAASLLTRVRIRTAPVGQPGAPVPPPSETPPASSGGAPMPAPRTRDGSRRPLIENPWFVIPEAVAILYAWNGNHHLILGVAVLVGVVVVLSDRLVRKRATILRADAASEPRHAPR